MVELGRHNSLKHCREIMQVQILLAAFVRGYISIHSVPRRCNKALLRIDDSAELFMCQSHRNYEYRRRRKQEHRRDRRPYITGVSVTRIKLIVSKTIERGSSPLAPVEVFLVFSHKNVHTIGRDRLMVWHRTFNPDSICWFWVRFPVPPLSHLGNL